MPQIISQDTTWTAGQVINLNEEVQIAHGATLTIEDGVVVNGNGNAIRAFGALVALDQNLDDVVFDDVQFLFGNQFDTPGSIRIEDAQILGGQFLPPTGNASYGAFSISNSVLSNVTGFYIWYPTSNSSFANNLFDGSQGLSIGTNAGVTLTVENNTFIDALPPLGGSSTVMVWANYGELQDISIVGNNFLDGLQTHLELQDGYDSSKLYSSTNYFQGFTSADAEGAVLDSQDSLTRSSDIVLENQRSSPNPAAPSVPVEPEPPVDPEPPVEGQLITGDELSNRLTGTAGNDTIDGGLGVDIAVYSGNQNSYSFTLSPTGTLIEDRRTDGNGTDTLISIELLDFDTNLTGGVESFDLQVFAGTVGLTAQDFESFIELYIAYFNRAPDAVGLNFWGTAFANGFSLDQMASLFFGQPETVNTYSAFLGANGTALEGRIIDIPAFVTEIYSNVLGRQFDQAGFDFWVDMLTRSDVTGVTPGQFIIEVLRGVQDGSPDRAYLDTKVDIGAYFGVHWGMSDVDNASAAMALFDGTQSSVNNAVAAIDGYYQDALDPNNGEFLMQVVGVLDNPFA